MTYVCVDGLGLQILESDLSATPYQAIIKATGFFYKQLESRGYILVNFNQIALALLHDILLARLTL